MVKPVILPNGKVWRTQKAALSHFRSILDDVANGERITDPAHHSDLSALLSVYDSDLVPTERKAGAGVLYFFRDRNPDTDFPTDCFWVHRIDETSIDFSYIKAVVLASRGG